MVHDTRFLPSGNWLPTPPTALLKRRDRSGSHRPSKSGRGLPKRFLEPFVRKKAIANERARPSQAAFHSQSLRLNCFDRVDLFPVTGPSPMKMQTTNVITAGMMRPITNSKPVETFSFATYGKEIEESVRSKGRLLGLVTEKAPPTAAIALRYVSSPQSARAIFGSQGTIAYIIMIQSRT